VLSAYQQSQILNLFSMAAADATSAPAELSLLFQWAEHQGIAEDDVHDVILGRHGVTFVPPANTLDAIGQLFDLSTMVHADALVAPEEERLLLSFAIRFGFEEGVARQVVTQLLAAVEAGQSRDAVLHEVRKELE